MMLSLYKFPLQAAVFRGPCPAGELKEKKARRGKKKGPSCGIPSCVMGEAKRWLSSADTYRASDQLPLTPFSFILGDGNREQRSFFKSE